MMIIRKFLQTIGAVCVADNRILQKIDSFNMHATLYLHFIFVTPNGTPHQPKAGETLPRTLPGRLTRYLPKCRLW